MTLPSGSLPFHCCHVPSTPSPDPIPQLLTSFPSESTFPYTGLMYVQLHHRPSLSLVHPFLSPSILPPNPIFSPSSSYFTNVSHIPATCYIKNSLSVHNRNIILVLLLNASGQRHESFRHNIVLFPNNNTNKTGKNYTFPLQSSQCSLPGLI